MDQRPRAGARTNLVRGTRVIAIGDENARDALPFDFRELLIAGLHRINAKISPRVLYEVPVEIVTMRFGKPRPGENTVQDLAHFVSLRSIAFEDSGFYDSTIFIHLSKL
jgi:hypothetical protein